MRANKCFWPQIPTHTYFRCTNLCENACIVGILQIHLLLLCTGILCLETFYLCDCDSAIFLTGTELCYEVITYCNKMMAAWLQRGSCFRVQSYTFPSFFIFSSNFSPHSQFSMLLFCFFSISVSRPDLLVHIWSGDLFCLTPVHLTTIAATFGWVYDPHWLIGSRPGYTNVLPKN